MEVMIATSVLEGIAKQHQLTIKNIQSNNPNDPPDVRFEIDSIGYGIELTELTLPNRLEINSIIRRLKDSILSQLPIGDVTKDWVVSVSLDTDNANKVRGRGLEKQIAETLKTFFSSDDIKTDRTHVLTLPNNRGKLAVYQADLSDEPGIQQRNEPLIVFSALNVTMYPDEDIPKMVEKALKGKFLIRSNELLWLLVWSEHMALTSFDNEILEAIKQYSTAHPHSFANIIYISLFNNTWYSLAFIRQPPPQQP